MRARRTTFILVLGLLYCLCAGQTLALFAAPAAGRPEVRLPVSAPPETGSGTAGSDLRFGSRAPAPAAAPATEAGPAQGVGTPTLLPGPETLRAETPALTPALPTPAVQGLGMRAAVPPAPTPPPAGLMSPGPELRMAVTPPIPPVLQESPAPGAGPTPPRIAEELGPDQWKLTADNVSGQHGSEYVQAEGNAVLTRGLNTLKADFMRYYQASRWVVLKGRVRVAWEGDILEAEEAEFDLVNMLGWLKNGKVFMGKSHIYFQSETVRKYAASSYRFKQAKVTACDGDKPAWSFTAEEGDITLDGRTKLWHSRFNVGDTPVVYSPFLSLPGAGRRQSGLLVPEISQSRVRGYSVNQPYYWAINEEHDLTFYENVMSRRGLMQGLEYRHAEDPRSRGDWRLDVLRDKKVATSSHDEELYLQGDGLLRPNKNRWWLRSKFNGFVGDPEWTLKVDLDAVSDQNYLREFGNGASGFDVSRRNFLKDFGRDIDVADSLTRNSVAFLSRSWERVGVTAKVGWTQNLAYMNDNSPAAKNPTVQSVPEVNLYAFKDALPGTPLDFELASRFNYFWRALGTRGSRVDLHPTLSLPLTFGPLTLIPSVGLRNTSYAVPKYSNEPPQTTTAKAPARTFPELGFTGFTEFHRVFALGQGKLDATAENVGKSQWLGLRHSVTPRVDFSYIPVPQSQDRLPSFDSLDRLTRKNVVTYSITNVLDRKRTSVMAAPSGNATIPVAATDYLDFLRLRLEQSFDRDEAARTAVLGQYTRRPFSDIMAEVSVSPEKYATLTSKTFYSPYLGRPTEHEHLLTLKKDKLGEIRFGHDYLYPLTEYKRTRTKDVQALRLGADVQLTPRLKLTSDYRYDIAGSADLEKSAALTWTDQCYELQLRYSRKPSDQNIELRFNLLDFGKQ